MIWRTQEFSNWMLTLQSGGSLSFHRGVPDPKASFARRLHRAQIERLFTDPAFARWFAHQYAGIDDGRAGPASGGAPFPREHAPREMLPRGGSHMQRVSRGT